MPYWELSPQLESLWLETQPRFRNSMCLDGDRLSLADTEELSEEELTTLQLPSALHQDLEMQAITLYRTIVAAAKGGRLRR